jgi:hypothetical protein
MPFQYSHDWNFSGFSDIYSTMRIKKVLQVLILLLPPLGLQAYYDDLVTTKNSALALAGRGNNVALGNNVCSILYNPASLVYTDSLDLLATFTYQVYETYLADVMAAFPISIGRDIAIAMNMAYYRSSEQILNAGLAVSAQFDMVKTGLYGSVFWDPDHSSEKAMFNGKLGVLLTPIFFKLGLVLENTYVDDQLAFLFRAQAGYKWKSLKFSAGLSRILKKDLLFIFNAGLDWQPLDWLGFVFNFEDLQISGGFYLSSLRTTFYFGSLYNPYTQVTDLSLSIYYNM